MLVGKVVGKHAPFVGESSVERAVDSVGDAVLVRVDAADKNIFLARVRVDARPRG